MGELTKLPNVGKVMETSLRSVGIKTPEQLRSVGSREAFMRIRAAVDPGACLHMLYGLQGAIEGVPYTRLSEGTKQELRVFFKSIG